MKRKRIGILVVLLIILLLIAISLSSGCVKKKERYTWDEDGPGKDEWWEPDFSVKANRGEIKNDFMWSSDSGSWEYGLIE